ESTVVKETARALVQPPGQGRGAIHSVRRSLSLKAPAFVVKTDLSRRVQIPAWFAEHRRHVTGGTLSPVIEDDPTAISGCRVEVLAGLWLRRGERELIELER